jgi:lycopene beta-cyclase
MNSCGAILVGGGLANCLLAYRLAQLRPDVEIRIVEANQIGGNHTWCFHDTDLTPEERAWLAPFLAHHWAGCEVRFPDRTRALPLGYNAISSEQMRAVVQKALGGSLVSGRADRVGAHEVMLEGGQVLTAPVVFDGRGARPDGGWGMAWQAFLGLQLRLAAPHGLARPIIMDADVPQEGAYRFVYTLPFSATEILIEDTRYQDGRDHDPTHMRAEVLSYARRQGWQVEEVIREERGMLPIVLSGRPHLPANGPVPVGMRAGLFHPVTGYSLPDAVRLADAIAAHAELTTEALHPFVLARVRRQWRRHGFYRLLNRMLFMAGAPDERWRILSRFYSLPASLIGRFYAGDTTATDMLRILSGRPPVPLRGALGCLRPSSARAFTGTAA